MSLIVISKVLRLLVNTFTADGKYSLLNRDNLTQPIHMQLSQKQKLFVQFFSAFLKFIFKLEHLEQKMNLIPEVLPK